MTFVLAVVLSAAVQAKPPVAPGPAQPPVTGTARITGTVRNAADDTPLARARVMALSQGGSEPRVAITGADGKYAIADLPAGAYTISATRTGYAPFTYGQGRSAAGMPVTVTAGQQLGNIDLPLIAGGVIVGRILDEDGAPFAGATVEALISRAQGGSDMPVSVATAQTDDRGEFRLFGLAPGSYYVSAADPAFANVGTAKGVLHYSPTYFPGTPLADQARRVTVGTGEPPRVEFKLQLVPPARISGQMIPSDGRQLLGGTITMAALAGPGVPMAAAPRPEMSPDGRFSFDGVAPGRYQIRARGETQADAAALFAAYSIEVSGRDVEGIRMPLRPGAMLDGTLTVDAARGSKPPELSTLRVRAPFTDGNAFGDSLTGLVQSNGSYALRGIMKGSHQIVVDGLEPPWAVTSVLYHGSDITDLELPVEERQQFRGVRIVISDRGSEVSGVVENSRQRPVANTGVLVCSNVPVFWVRTSRRLRVTYTDQNGRWRVNGLPPGEYFAVAAPLVDESDLGQRDRLEALQAIGTAFRVDSDQARSTLTLQLNAGAPAAAVR